MPTAKKLLGLAASLSFATLSFAAEGEGVTPAAAKLVDFGNGWAITNSMATGWAMSAVIISVILYAVRKPRILPTKSQAVFETLIETLRDLFEPIVGKKAFPAAFPLLVTLFIFILINNWMGLLPGVGTVGWEKGFSDGSEQFVPWIRPHNADFNGTIALALVSFGAYLIIIFKYAGPKLILWDLFGNKADKKETPAWLYYGLSVIFLMVGFIEIFSILLRPFTLSVRLFGNIFGGETLLHNTSFFPVFYFMELLAGGIQALVFTLLSAVYIGLICNHGDDHEHGDNKEGHAVEAHH
jgi:F-type H+-transporting ATPase subunit a